MKISTACDHGAYELKERLKAHLVKQGHEVVDCGANSLESCDYPDYARPAAQLVADGTCDRGVVLCTTPPPYEIASQAPKVATACSAMRWP